MRPAPLIPPDNYETIDIIYNCSLRENLTIVDSFSNKSCSDAICMSRNQIKSNSSSDPFPLSNGTINFKLEYCYLSHYETRENKVVNIIIGACHYKQ